MRLRSVNVSLPKEVVHQGRTVRTAIYKTAVAGRVMARNLGVDGDGQADRSVHGGPDMAVYAYPFEHYAYWQEALGRDDFTYGQFGENLTVEGLTEDEVRVGDVYRVGGALLQVTQPRIPCFKLAMRMAAGPDFPARFQASGRMGFYLRVRREGEIGAGDAIEPVDRDETSVTIAEFIATYLHHMHDPARLRRVLWSRDLAEGWREHMADALGKATPKVGAATWTGFRNLVVDRKVRESDSVTSFYLVPQDRRPLPPYKPGQYLPLRLDIPGREHPLTRTYTLSDAPHGDYYRLSIKREAAPADRSELPPGLSSTYFHDLVGPGTVLCAKAPRGDFFLDANGERPIALVSAGVGITPMIAMLNAAAVGGRRPAWFVHGNRSGREHAMAAHVRQLAASHPQLHVHYCYSRPGERDRAGRDYDSAGHVDIDLLRRVLPGNDFDFYLCGPPPFMRSLYNGLLAWGVAEPRIHYEFFGPATVLKAGAGPTRAAGADGGVAVSFARSGVTVNWDGSAESILDLAEANGLRPAFSCRSGICHTCMTRLVAGEVRYILDIADEPDPGYVLICCSRPKTDVVLDV